MPVEYCKFVSRDDYKCHFKIDKNVSNVYCTRHQIHHKKWPYCSWCKHQKVAIENIKFEREHQLCKNCTIEYSPVSNNTYTAEHHTKVQAAMKKLTIEKIEEVTFEALHEKYEMLEDFESCDILWRYLEGDFSF